MRSHLRNHHSLSCSNGRRGTTLLLLRLALSLAPVSRLQRRHARLADLGILLEEDGQRICLDHGGELELEVLFPLLFRLAVGGSDQDGEGLLRVEVGKGVLGRRCRSVLAVGYLDDDVSLGGTGRRKGSWQEFVRRFCTK